MFTGLVGRFRAINKITAERDRVVNAHGYTVESDADKTAGDFLVYLQNYVNRGISQHADHSPIVAAQVDETITKIGGLCLAYLESREEPELDSARESF